MEYTIGLDYGTGSVRAVLVNVATGEEVAESIYKYKVPEGLEGKVDGVITDRNDPNVARQDPNEYLIGMQRTVRAILRKAKNSIDGFNAIEHVIGISTDTTGSTPMPVNSKGTPLAMLDEFRKNPNAYAWLWKDHSGHAESAEITEKAKEQDLEHLTRCGMTYSSEWFFSKVLHCMRVAPDVAKAAFTWYEHSDYMPAVLTGTTQPSKIKRWRTSAGHKAMFATDLGGYPIDFLNQFDTGSAQKLGEVAKTLGNETDTIDHKAGGLCEEWARKLGLKEGIAVGGGTYDAHIGAVGSGIGSGTLVINIGTSRCDMAVLDGSQIPNIVGICGIVDGSILPGKLGVEAGSSAVGDVFNAYATTTGKSIDILTKEAESIQPGHSGLVALALHNGSRSVPVNQRLTGGIIGETLQTTAAEKFRAYIESTAYQLLDVINRLEESGTKISTITACGGIADKNPLVMQIYADVTGREIKIANKPMTTAALGSAIVAAVAAGKANGGYDNFEEAQKAMAHVREQTYKPIEQNVAVYKALYEQYKSVHDAMTLTNNEQKAEFDKMQKAKQVPVPLNRVMAELLDIKEFTRGVRQPEADHKYAHLYRQPAV